MKYPYGRCYVEVKDRRYLFHPIEIIIVKLQVEPKSLRSQYQVQKNTQIKKSQKVFKCDNDELEVEIYLQSKQPFIQTPKFKPSKKLVVKQKKMTRIWWRLLLSELWKY